MKWFAVQGRVPKDDDDSVMVYQAHDAEDAKVQFRNSMNEGVSPDDLAADDAAYDTTGGVYINAVLESDTEIRVL